MTEPDEDTVHTEPQYDPWFPSAEAALEFPEGVEVPEGMTYKQWKEAN